MGKRLMLVPLGAVVLALTPLMAMQKSDAPDLLKVRADLVKAQAQLASAKKELATVTFQAEQCALSVAAASLEGEFRSALKPDAAATFDWNTLTYVVPKEKPDASAPATR